MCTILHARAMKDRVTLIVNIIVNITETMAITMISIMVMNIAGTETTNSILKMVNISNCVVVILVLLFLNMCVSRNSILPGRPSAVWYGRLRLMTWNASGIMSSGSYLGHVLGTYDIDICGVSEHWLYKKDLHFLDSVDSDYNYSAVSDSDLELPSRRRVGKGGVALFWKRTIDSRVSILNIDDDRLVGIQYQVSHNSYTYIIQAYLPSANHPISELNDYLLKLQDICSMYDRRGTVILMEDFNAHFNGEKFIKPHDRRSNLFLQFIASNNLISINTLEMCTGAMSTYVSYSGEQYSMIDHILLPIEKYDLVTFCEILDDDALNVSNHRPICFHVKLSHAEETTTAAPSVRKSV